MGSVSTQIIDQKYAETIAEATDNLKEFWSIRNVRLLSSFYQKWSNDLALHKMNALRPIELFFKTIDDLFEIDEKTGQCLVFDQPKSGVYAQLLTQRELIKEVSDLKLKLIHETAIKLFKYEDLKNIENHDEYTQFSYRFLNQSTSHMIEKSIHFGELDLPSLEKLNDLNQKVKDLLDQIQKKSPRVQQIKSLFKEVSALLSKESENKEKLLFFIQQIETHLDQIELETPYLMKIKALLKSQSLDESVILEINPLLNRLENYLFLKNLFTALSSVQKIKALYEEKIELLKDKNLSSMNEYMEWIRTLQFLRLEAQKSLNLTHPESQSATELQKHIHEIIAEENRVHSLAHHEHLEFVTFYEPLLALTKADVRSLFNENLTANEIFLFDTRCNKFTIRNLEQSNISEKDVLFCLNQIHKLISLLTHNNACAITLAEYAFKEDFSIAKAIKMLLQKMNEIEIAYYNEDKKFKRPQMALKVDKEIQVLCKMQIENVFQSVSLKMGVQQIETFFQKGSTPHFYLKLAKDLGIISTIGPQNLPQDVILKLVADIEREEEVFQEESFLENFATDENQLNVLKSYKALRNIHKNLLLSPELKSLYSKEITSHMNHFKEAFQEHAIEALDYLISICDSKIQENKLLTSSEKREEEKVSNNQRNIDEKANEIFKMISPEKFHAKFPQAFFYLDLALRNPYFEFSFNIKSQPLNSIQMAVLNKMIGYYRLHMQNGVLANKNLTPLYKIVSQPDLHTASFPFKEKLSLMPSEVIEEINALDSVNKLRNKFTEILLHGLRTYHSMFGALTTFLDWRDEDLKAEFVNHVLRKKMRKEKKLTQAPIKSVFEAYKKELGQISESVFLQAEELQKEFCSYLEYYRAIQREHYKFYSSLGNIFIHNQNILDLPDLTLSDIDLFEKNIDSIKIGFYNDMDQKVALNLKNHIQALKELVQRTPKEKLAKAFFDFISPLKNEKEIFLIHDQVSYLNLKLLIKTIKVIEEGKKIKGVNLNEFEKLFTAPKSYWKQFAMQTQIATSLFIERQLDAFISEKEQLEKNRFFTDLRPSIQDDQIHLWEYFGFAPIRMTIASINTLSKWNSYKEDLQKRIKGEIIQKTLRAIAAASFKMNEELNIRAAIKEKKRATILEEM